MRIRYRKIKVVDGDTVKILYCGMSWYLRIERVDTDETKDKNKRLRRRAGKQTEILKSFCQKLIKPRIYATLKKDRDGWPAIQLCPYGRWLVKVKVWSWWRFRFIDYSDYMVDTGNVKKGSSWNKR